MKRIPSLAILALATGGAALAQSKPGAPVPPPTMDLAGGFLNPPDAAKPQTWWHWREGRINKQAITAELEAMKRIGVGGVTMFSVIQYGETGTKVACLSPEWHERVRFAMKECDRLGLTFLFQNCAGWSGAGGPWITPDLAMQHVTTEKHAVEGGATLTLTAPPSWPESGASYYRDIALLAFPTPAACHEAKPLPAPAVTTSGLAGDPAILNGPASSQEVTANTPALSVDTSQAAWVQFEFPAAVTCRSVVIAGTPAKDLPDDQRPVVSASDDGKNFREIVRLATYKTLYSHAASGVTHAIPQTKARFFRLAWEGPVKLALRRVAWSADPAIDSGDSKGGEIGRSFLAEPNLPTDAGTAVPLTGIIDLTSRLDAKGNLAWTAPNGHWSVVRVGYRNGSQRNMPAPPEATGLECDKFNPAAVASQFNHYAAEMLKDAAAVNSKALTGMIFDSWEAQSQNWSPVFRDEFRKRRGYDVLPYLPAFAGFIVGDRDLTDRFLRDVRQTMSDLVCEVFFGGMSELAHQRGLQVHAESCGGSGAGTMVADAVQHYLHVDVPMNEFSWPLKEAVSGAHVSGKSVVALEAYTQGRIDWRSCPESLKAQGDAAYCAGINRFVFHTYAHNPDPDRLAPGPAFGPYGLAFSRGQTWWDMGAPWIQYLTRCQFLLQRGKPAADVLYFYGEEPAGPLVTVFGADAKNLDHWPALPAGFDYDLLPAETLIQNLSFKDGKLTLPDGTCYRLLVLRDSQRMTPQAAAKIQSLVRDGATVVGPKPQRSVSLSDYPNCDTSVRAIGEDVWGECNGTAIRHHAFGKGHVFWGMPLSEVLASIPLAADFAAAGAQDVRFIHRRDGAAEIYFIASANAHDRFDATFRVSGKQPEIWDPLIGTTRPAGAFRQHDGLTTLPLRLEPHGSLFVIFRTPIAGDAAGTATRNLPTFHQIGSLLQPWTVAFTPGWGAPATVTFPTLDDWSQRPEPGIKYYSGTATYLTEFDAPAGRPVHLNLGKVAVIAEVTVNGISCGIAWTPPYRLDITKALRPGRNQLQVRVANTWANRLMGEGRVPGATLHASTTKHLYTADSQPFESGLLGPVTLEAPEDF